jgi:hypothetical protein
MDRVRALSTPGGGHGPMKASATSSSVLRTPAWHLAEPLRPTVTNRSAVAPVLDSPPWLAELPPPPPDSGARGRRPRQESPSGSCHATDRRARRRRPSAGSEQCPTRGRANPLPERCRATTSSLFLNSFPSSTPIPSPHLPVKRGSPRHRVWVEAISVPAGSVGPRSTPVDHACLARRCRQRPSPRFVLDE